MAVEIQAPIDPVEALEKQFGDEVILYNKEFADEVTVVVAAEHIVAVMKFLKSTPGLMYNFLHDISAVDYYPADYGEENGYDGTGKDFRPERFGVSYHIFSMLYGRTLRVKTFAAEEAPSIPTLTGVWIGADWPEREVLDMMGIEFEGHPDPRRILMPADWQGHPHRRDYPLGYETPMFSFNADEIQRNKPLAKK